MEVARGSSYRGWWLSTPACSLTCILVLMTEKGYSATVTLVKMPIPMVKNLVLSNLCDTEQKRT